MLPSHNCILTNTNMALERKMLEREKSTEKKIINQNVSNTIHDYHYEKIANHYIASKCKFRQKVEYLFKTNVDKEIIPRLRM